MQSLMFAACAAAIASTPAIASTHPPKARISIAKARAIALRAAPGKIVDAEYEKEAGAWRYSFDIRQGKRIHEIGVSATTGKIVENKFEGLKDKD
jgi:uncharacterized membrane protein YkoI